MWSSTEIFYHTTRLIGLADVTHHRSPPQPGGRLIIPVGRDDQELLQVDKQADGSIVQQRVLGVRYVPLVPGLAQ